MDVIQEGLTFDEMTNAAAEIELTEGPSVGEEIHRCRKIYENRQEHRRKKAIDIKPLYHEHMQRRDLVAKYPVYKFFCIYPKPPKKYAPCQHIGKVTLDRDILTKDEHISYLAQPKKNFGRYQSKPHCAYQRRYLPNCTTRIESLAHPKPRRVQQNWQEYRHLLSVRQAANLRRNLQKPPIEYTTIENALTYIHEERRLKAEMKKEALKKCDQIKRELLKMERQYTSKIIFALYEVMKEFLISDQFVTESGEMTSLCKVIECKLMQFCGFENMSTSHVQHLIRTVAQNLAIWIEKFTANCGFRNARSEREMKHMEDACKPMMEDQEFLLPVEDFIPYRSPSCSDQQEGYVDAEDFGDVCEFEIE